MMVASTKPHIPVARHHEAYLRFTYQAPLVILAESSSGEGRRKLEKTRLLLKSLDPELEHTATAHFPLVTRNHMVIYARGGWVSSGFRAEAREAQVLSGRRTDKASHMPSRTYKARVGGKHVS